MSAPTQDLSDPNFRLSTYPFYLLGHLDHRYTEVMESALAERRLSRPMWRSLISLRDNGPRSIGQLADITLLKRSTLSRVVDRMERDGLVERRTDGDDLRIINVHITEAGQDALGHVIQVAGRVYARAIEGLSDRELNELVALLSRMLDNLSRSPYA